MPRRSGRGADELTCTCFQIADGADFTVRVPGSDGQIANFRCTRKGKTITLACEGKAAQVKVIVHNEKALARVSNAKRLTAGPEGVAVQWTDTAKPVTITLG